jgi:hypothetical protein
MGGRGAEKKDRQTLQGSRGQKFEMVLILK